MKPLRVVYMGTPEFAVPALRALIASQDEVVGVFTNPDRPSGRGKKLKAPPVKEVAEAAGVPVVQPQKARGPEVVARLKEWAPDVIVVAAYGQILKADVLDLPPMGCLNIHASLLPKYRGAAPINYAIMAGEEEAGVTIMKMEEGLDTGPMILKKKTLIAPLETAQELHDRLAIMGADLIVDVMRLLHLESVTLIPQDDTKATWAPMLSKADGAIDWTRSARQVVDQIRGLNPWPGCYSYLRREAGESVRVKFHLARRAPDEEFGGAPGTVVAVDPGQGILRVATGQGCIDCLELQAPGRRAMEIGDFLNGFEVHEGEAFVREESNIL